MDDANVFVYTGAGRAEIPQDVARVTSIPRFAFAGRRKLAEVELCEGLVEIGQSSFMFCEHSLTKINIPNSLRTIGIQAFWNSLRCPFRLHDGIETIGIAAFFGCIFTNFRVPPLITVIPDDMVSSCKSLFSLELPEIVLEIGSGAFKSCYCLRNVAFPPNAVFGDNIFLDNEMDIITDVRDLQLLFGSVTEIIWALQHRFDGLPIHSLVYYQSYQQGVLQHLIAAIKLRSGQTGSQQDCLGMTPLHILTCSSVHSLEIYRLIVENYPANLITEDKWGALPLLYAFWGAAPTEIIQFLIISYRSLYPDHVLNWTMMVETMWSTGTPKECIVCLLCVKQKHFPEQPLNWDRLLFKIANSLLVSNGTFSFGGFLFQERMCILLMCGVSSRVEALPFIVWRESIINMIYTAEFKRGDSVRRGDNQSDNEIIESRIQAKIAQYEDSLSKLKDATTILELALFKLRINENNIRPEDATHCQKKIKSDEASIRQQCRITCGADVVIRHVLPYLISVVDEE